MYDQQKSFICLFPKKHLNFNIVHYNVVNVHCFHKNGQCLSPPPLPTGKNDDDREDL